jgi:hypothetical protein
MWVVKFSAPGSRQEESLVIHSVLASSNDATLGRVAVQKPVAEGAHSIPHLFLFN